MKTEDPGHFYSVSNYDGNTKQYIRFVKREGIGYPRNQGSHSGTNCQELLRVLIDRVQYLNFQIPCYQNRLIVLFMRLSIWLFELRAAKRHNRSRRFSWHNIELIETCRTCGHIKCTGKHHV